MYYEDKKKSRIILNQLKFFKTKPALSKYIEENDLELRVGLIEALIAKIKSYIAGEKINLFKETRNLIINLALPTSKFQEQVLMELSMIPYGVKTSYFEIGEKIRSKAYRAIGNACKNNPLPLIYPCHRVLRKDGTLGGFMGEIDEGWQINLKKKLLNIEGFSYVLD